MFLGRGAALHKGRIRAFHWVAPGSNHGSDEIFFSLLWTVEKSNPSIAYARDFSNTLSD